MRRPGLFEELQTRQVFQCGVDLGVGTGRDQPGLRAHPQGEGVVAQRALQSPWRPTLGLPPGATKLAGPGRGPPCACSRPTPEPCQVVGLCCSGCPCGQARGSPGLPLEGNDSQAPGHCGLALDKPLHIPDLTLSPESLWHLLWGRACAISPFPT